MWGNVNREKALLIAKKHCVPSGQTFSVSRILPLARWPVQQDFAHGCRIQPQGSADVRHDLDG